MQIVTACAHKHAIGQVRRDLARRATAVATNQSSNFNGVARGMGQEACGMLLQCTSHSFKVTDVNYILCGKSNNRPRTETWQRIKIHTLTVKDCQLENERERERERESEAESGRGRKR